MRSKHTKGYKERLFNQITQNDLRIFEQTSLSSKHTYKYNSYNDNEEIKKNIHYLFLWRKQSYDVDQAMGHDVCAK